MVVQASEALFFNINIKAVLWSSVPVRITVPLFKYAILLPVEHGALD